MDVESAVANLANPDESVKLRAIEVCSCFQTPPYFDWTVLLRLVNPGSRANLRLFGYQTLLILLKRYWGDLRGELREQIRGTFPFVAGDAMADPLCQTIIQVDAAFLVYAADLEMIAGAFVGGSVPYNSSLLSEFVVACGAAPVSGEREAVVKEVLRTRGVGLVRALILDPLVSCEAGGAEFQFFLKRLADVHVSSELVNALLSDADVVRVYSAFVPYLWEASDNASIVAICESVLDSSCDIGAIVLSLGMSEQSSFLKGFEPLFISSVSVDATVYVSYLSSFLCRIPVFFQLLERFGPKDLGPFLVDSARFLQATAPSIICDTASMLDLLFRKYKNNQEFAELLRQERIQIFEACVRLIATPSSSLPGAGLDENWSDFSFRTGLFNLVRTIVDLFDSQALVPDLIRMILGCSEETTMFVSLVRILSAVIKPPLDISSNCKELVTFLLGSINKFSMKTQNYACTLLSKLLDFLVFDDQELNSFFRELVTMFITQKPAAFDPFTAFFNSFVEHFASRIVLPMDQLQAVPQNDPCYFTISTMIARFTGKESPLDLASVELQWFIFNFRFDDYECMARLGKGVARSLEFLSNIQQQSDITHVNEMIQMLVQTNNVMVRAADNVNDERQAARFYSPMSHLAKAIQRFAELNPQVFVQVLPNMCPPSLFSNCAVLWVKRVAIPLLSFLFQSNKEIATQTALCWCGHFTPIIAQVEATPACVFEPTAKKIATLLCQLCVLMSDEDAIQYMSLCLKFDDFRVFSAVVDACHAKGISVLARMWEELLCRQDQPSVDKLAGILFDLWQENNGDYSSFLVLSGVTEEMLWVLSQQVANASTDRRKRRHFRRLITK